MENTDIYVKAMMSLVARQTFPPETLAEKVSPRGIVNIMEAYNLCDGTRSQSKIAEEKGIDTGNLSRLVNQWLDDGILIRVYEGNEERPVHVYPIPEAIIRKFKKKVGNKNG